MKVAVIGSGYVGLVAGTCFADCGNDVICVDVDVKKIEDLRRGILPIYEPGLEQLVEKNVAAKRLTFTTDLPAAVKQSQVVFIAVGTPEGEDGSADLTYVLGAAREIGRAIEKYTIVVDKSTVPVGTADKVRAAIREVTQVEVDVVSNPEFLKEGAAIEDFQRPDRVVIGVASEKAREIMGELYAPFVRTEHPIFFMDPRSAELTKYAANSMLATRISFMNEIAALCERVGADVDLVRKGVGSDKRIGMPFLFPGTGYGGSCLAGDETVLVRDSAGTRMTRLDRLWRAKAGVEPGPTGAAASVEGLEVLAWDPKERAPRFAGVEALTCRPYEAPMREVRTKLGRRLSVTADHPFVVRDASGGTVTKRADELRGTDFLPLALGLPIGEAPRVLRIEDGFAAAGVTEADVILRPTEAALAAVEPAELREAVTKLGRHDKPGERVRDILRAGALRMDEARAARVSLVGAVAGTAKNGTYVPLELPLDEVLCRILGLYLAEGHVSADGRRRRLAWSFHPNAEEYLVDEVASYWRSLGVKADVRDMGTARAVSVSSRLLAGLFLGPLALGADCYSHGLPDFVWSAPERLRRALLSGLWHGDGSASLVAGGPSAVLEYGTVSTALADGMIRLLGSLGVAARWKRKWMRKSTVPAQLLIVAGADQIERVAELVRPPARAALLASIGRQKKRIAPTGYQRDGDGTAWVRVTEVLTTRPARHVYSLEVPGVHTFVTTGGLVTHNCFPKDVQALVKTADQNGLQFPILRAVEEVNDRQKTVLLRKAQAHFGGALAGRKFAVWGLAFKPRTDDMREAPSVELIHGLLAAGATVIAHDPVAHEAAKRVLGETITYADNPYDALPGVDALFLVTEWNDFRFPDFDRMKAAMKAPVLFDGRNVWDPRKMRERGFVYAGIGRV